MNPSVRTRLIILVAALGTVAGMTFWGMSAFEARIRLLEGRLNVGLLESFRLSDGFQRRLQNLNILMMRYAVERESEEWRKFELAGQELREWLDKNDPSLNPQSQLVTELERESFRDVKGAYEAYRRSALSVKTNQAPAVASKQLFTQLEDFERHNQILMQLGIRLAEAHHLAEVVFLTEANRALDHLHYFLTGAVVLTLGLTAALGVVVYRDMIAPLRTKLVQSETLLQRQEKLATLGTLAAGIAHEIRNPLTSIKARLFMLERRLHGQDAAATDTQVIGSEVSRLERIVQEVLQFARPTEPKLRVASVAEPIRDVVALMQASLSDQGVRLVHELVPDAFAYLDPMLIKQVLINLVRNAAEAMSQGGDVVVRLSVRPFRLEGELRPVVLIEVADNGPGIPPEVEKRLFDPFFTTKEAGTGLGLSIAARIIERHHGALQYQTRPGHGTTFGILLPRIDPPPPPTPSHS